MDNTPTSVYRYYDADNVLIYVGITSRGHGRAGEHNKRAAWWAFVERQRIDHFETRDAALATERAWIKQYRPPFNTQHNQGAEMLRSIYLSYAANQRSEVFVDAWKRVHGRLPLRLTRVTGSTYVFGTSVDDAALTASLRWTNERGRGLRVKVYDGLVAVGDVMDVFRAGPAFAVETKITGEVGTIIGASSRLRWLKEGKKGLPVVQMRSVTLDIAGKVAE